ncbi:MAG: hypothetical protein LBS28_03475 [Streptococcaceae bacterium]|jgi:chromosome segregation ATPase|nr:hypothetical protein [Streptococcaceae bacterium]
MEEAVSNYEVELEELSKVMGGLEKSLISTKEELKEEIEKNANLTKDLHKLKQKCKDKLSLTKNTKQVEDQLKFTLKKLESTQEQAFLLKKELAKVQDKLSKQLSQNHRISVENETLKQDIDNLTAKLYEKTQTSASVKKVEISQADMPFSTNVVSDYEKRMQNLQNELSFRDTSLFQQREENKKLKEKLSSVKQQMFSKEEMAEMFVQAKKLAREKILKEQAQAKSYEEEKHLNALNEEKDKLYAELLKMAQMNQKFISCLSELKNKERHFARKKGIEENE